MLGKLKPENLPVYLAKIDRLFPEFSKNSNVKEDSIRDYYRESFWGYAFFHSWAGAIHMALSKQDKFSKSDYFTQAIETEEIINELLKKGQKLNVLEVGCGRGFNLRYLSKRFPTVDFFGIDLSKRNIQAARKDLSKCPNVSLEVANFNSLTHFKEGQFDLVLAVETLCHSLNLETTLKSIARVTRQDGVLVVFDGFRGMFSETSPDMMRAIEYTERAMAVPRFSTTDEFISAAERNGYSKPQKWDRSEEIMPNLIRLSDIAKAYFKINVLSRVLLLALPRGLVTNSIAGLLMAITVDSKAHSYWKMIFKKN